MGMIQAPSPVSKPHERIAVPDSTEPDRKILVTGSRNWTDEMLLEATLLKWLIEQGRPRNVILIHGNCRGADVIAARYWADLGLYVLPVDAEWEEYGKSAGPIRNQKMIDMNPEICFAFPMKDSRGTYDCIDRAQKAGIPVIITKPGSWDQFINS